MENKINAEVISVYPDKVKISVDKIEDFRIADESLRVGSYLKVEDNENCILICIIENFSLEIVEEGGEPKRKYIIEANPLGLIKGGEFIRGGDSLTIPPKEVKPATEEEIRKIYEKSLKDEDKFVFSTLSSNKKIDVPVDGNKFFNKHIAIVGSTGSGKSHTVAKIIQEAVSVKDGKFKLNNSHIVVFDIHSEYKAAFPEANFLDIENDSLILPYWLLNGEELEEVLLDTGERDNYNQASVFRTLVTANKKLHNKDLEDICYDTPVFWDIDEVITAINNLRKETKNAKSTNMYMINDGSYKLKEGKTNEDSGVKLIGDERILKYFEKEYDFCPLVAKNVNKGNYADGTLDKFAVRISSKIRDERLQFLFGSKAKESKFEDVLRLLLGYVKEKNSNVTIIDLSGVPFEVLSITVSLISRIIFEYGYYYKKIRCSLDKNEKINNNIPVLLVYEEAHKYVPRSDLSKYRAAKKSIERIAKEGRKYGVALLLASQRPSEISETIFSQCNNFIAMRLTNPNDQSYVKKLLPDTMGSLIGKMPSLKAGEALLMGDSVIIPSIVQINTCDNPPSSNDIPYWMLWKKEWKNLNFEELKKEWY